MTRYAALHVTLSSAALLCGALGYPTFASAQSAQPPTTAELADLPLFGVKDGLVYLRDRRDFVRLYPHAHVDLDVHGFFGPEVGSLPIAVAGVDLAPRFFVRRARLGVGGELLKLLAFNVGVNFVANPAIDGGAVDGTDTRIAVDDAWASFGAGRAFRIMLGVFQAPFSLENRSATSDLAMMERNLAIRGFVLPSGRALGGALGGATKNEFLRWDIGAFGAETAIPGEFAQHWSAVGRATMRPAADVIGSPVRGLQFGASARVGERNPRDVVEDTAAINTGQGFSLWRPTRIDGAGHTVHIIPSGLDWAAGGELRIPVRSFALRTEAYWVSRGTREALEGFQATNSERFGTLQGVGWYAEVSMWPLQMGGIIVAPTPSLGDAPRIDHLELARTMPPPQRYGLEIAVLGAGINARYDAASRLNSTPDKSAPPAKAIETYQAGLAFNYWHSSYFRVSLNGNVYVTPGSGGPDNLAKVPGNLGPKPDADAHYLFEVGARTSVMF